MRPLPTCHPQTGKGRTSVVCACTLAWLREFDSAVTALDYVCERRYATTAKLHASPLAGGGDASTASAGGLGGDVAVDSLASTATGLPPLLGVDVQCNPSQIR